MLENIKKVVQAEVDKKTKFIQTESTIDTRKVEYELLYQAVAKMKEDNVEMPDEVVFENYDMWLEDIDKKLKSRANALNLVERDKYLIVAFNYFLENADDLEELEA